MDRNPLLDALHDVSNNGLLTYPQFIDIALYHDKWGYYQREAQRVGRHEQADFYTSSSLGEVFKRLVLSSIVNLIGQETCVSSTFVEIGAEPHTSFFDEMKTPFAGHQTIGINDDLVIPQHSVVFANELLDAQPFHRLVFHDHAWREIGIRLEGTTLHEALLPQVSTAMEPYLAQLPTQHSEGYILDFPLGAEQLLSRLASLPWEGLLLLFDYGKTWGELLESCPQGTGRAYTAHKMKNNLLDTPGEQDITCHICWDRLEDILRKHQFTQVTCERQEAFCVHHAQDEIQKIIHENPAPFDPARQTLKELIHPALMGNKFQALWAIRKTAP